MLAHYEVVTRVQSALQVLQGGGMISSFVSADALDDPGLLDGADFVLIVDLREDVRRIAFAARSAVKAAECQSVYRIPVVAVSPGSHSELAITRQLLDILSGEKVHA